MHSLPPWLTTTYWMVRLGSQSCKVFNVMVVKSLKMSFYANHWQYWLVCFFVGTNWSSLLPFRKTTYDLFHYIFKIYLYSFYTHYYVQIKNKNPPDWPVSMEMQVPWSHELHQQNQPMNCDNLVLNDRINAK